MKFIGALILVQISLVLLLFVKLDSIEVGVTVPGEPSRQTTESKPVVTLPPPSVTVAESARLDGTRVRRIVREELQAALISNDFLTREPPADSQEPFIDEAEMQYQHDLVLDELEFLKTQDFVTPVEMEKLMGNIARLDPERRTELLAMLNRAMNKGEIKGNL